jgi:hypothetical protein
VKFSTRGGEKSKGAKDQKVEVTVYSKEGTFRAEEHEGSLYAAIDKTADKLARTLRKRKEKKAKKGNTSTREVPVAEISVDLDGGMDPLKYGVFKLPEEVVRTKYFEVRFACTAPLVVRGPSALVHACCIDRWHIRGRWVAWVRVTLTLSHSGPSGVAEAAFVRIACR